MLHLLPKSIVPFSFLQLYVVPKLLWIMWLNRGARVCAFFAGYLQIWSFYMGHLGYSLSISLLIDIPVGCHQIGFTFATLCLSFFILRFSSWIRWRKVYRMLFYIRSLSTAFWCWKFRNRCLVFHFKKKSGILLFCEVDNLHWFKCESAVYPVNWVHNPS